MSMDKYGVEIDDQKEKTAGERKTCPGCGQDLTELDKNGQALPYCPRCGTEPWERKPSPSKSGT